MSRFMCLAVRKLPMVVCLGLLMVAMASVACAGVLINENFGSNPSWAANNNTSYGTNNYTFSNTNNAGGTAGEGGGDIMSRTAGKWTWYADDIGASGTFGMDEETFANGRLLVAAGTANLDGGFEIGFFNSDDPVAANDLYGGIGGMVESMALRITDSSSTQVKAFARVLNGDYGTATGGSGSPIILDIGTQYLWDAQYAPNGGGAGVGKLDLEIRKASDNSLVGTCYATNAIASGWALDSFGISTLNFPSDVNGPKVYIDNLTYGWNTIPEPTALVLLSTGLLGLLAYAWRKRK